MYTTQTYDWKGRPLRTIHPDGYYTELSYSGCGCAGGEVVTATDENNRARTTSDVLGRLIKRGTELTRSNIGVRSVYSTANYVYNALDQVMTITHEGQVRSFNYDGYGRLISAPRRSKARQHMHTMLTTQSSQLPMRGA